MPLGPGPEVDQQSFFDSVADREITIAGYTGLIRDLVELCPVKDDPTRFTTEAKDAFAANAWVASGNEMPEQYAHLVKPRETDKDHHESRTPTPSREKDDSRSKKSRTEDPREKDIAEDENASVIPEEIPKSLSEQEERIEQLTTEIAAIRAQGEEVRQSLLGTNEDIEQAHALPDSHVRLYLPKRELHEELSAHTEAQRQSTEIFEDSNKVSTTVEPEEATEGHTAPAAGQTQKDETKIEIRFEDKESASVYQPALNTEGEAAVIEAAAEFSGTDYDYPGILPALHEFDDEQEEDASADDIFEQELAQFWQEETEVQESEALEAYNVLAENQLQTEFMPEIISEFSAEEAAELDDILGFDFIQTDETTSQDEKTVYSELAVQIEATDFLEAVYVNIETIEVENPETAQQALEELEIINELAVEVSIIELDQDADVQRLESLKSELYEHAEELLLKLGKEPDDRLVRRFVERILVSETKKLVVAMSEQTDGGTHEDKTGLANLLDDFVTLEEKAALLVRILGRQSLLLAHFRTPAAA